TLGLLPGPTFICELHIQKLVVEGGVPSLGVLLQIRQDCQGPKSYPAVQLSWMSNLAVTTKMTPENR
ncbi:3318_t:CDS:2, partial [Cetraspora pellucida]